MLFFISLFLFSCQTDYEKVEVNDIAIKTGIFFGFCGGYCKSEVEIVNRDVVFIASSWSDPNYPDTMLNGNISIQEWNSLIESINMDDIVVNPEKISNKVFDEERMNKLLGGFN